MRNNPHGDIGYEKNSNPVNPVYARHLVRRLHGDGGPAIYHADHMALVKAYAYAAANQSLAARGAEPRTYPPLPLSKKDFAVLSVAAIYDVNPANVDYASFT